MNRRQLIKSLGQGALGASAAVLGVKAAPEEKPPMIIKLRVETDAVIRVIEEDFKKNGRMRQLITDAASK